MRFLADECCPRAIVIALRTAGHDVRYAAETDISADDETLIDLARAEQRIIVSEDFDFGELLIRDRRPSNGAIILFLPKLAPSARAERLLAALGRPELAFDAGITIIEARRIRQRRVSL
jgi:predicted nuclease of predicted toxin-antitoxin system